MGLCKCPKKNVTNQFCFEHCVNVCEHCMVTSHPKCVVQSFLLWLQDSDYDPNCQLCKTKLSDGECIRLVCFHVFHWECLNKYASELLPHTAPAGYMCPICNTGIFPPPNMASPVAEALRNQLLGVNWARCGLTFPGAEEASSSQQIHRNSSESSPKKSTLMKMSEHANKPSEGSSHFTNTKHIHTHKIDANNRPEPYGAAFTPSNFPASRKMYDSTDHGLFRPSVVDPDEDKYKRRSVFESLSRWLFSRALLSKSRRRDPNILYKKWVVLGMLAVIALCTVCIFFLRMGRASADMDPMLDPHMNPNIRVQESVDALHDAINVVDKNAMPLDKVGKQIEPR